MLSVGVWLHAMPRRQTAMIRHSLASGTERWMTSPLTRLAAFEFSTPYVTGVAVWKDVVLEFSVLSFKLLVLSAEAVLHHRYACPLRTCRCNTCCCPAFCGRLDGPRTRTGARKMGGGCGDVDGRNYAEGAPQRTRPCRLRWSSCRQGMSDWSRSCDRPAINGRQASLKDAVLSADEETLGA